MTQAKGGSAAASSLSDTPPTCSTRGLLEGPFFKAGRERFHHIAPGMGLGGGRRIDKFEPLQCACPKLGFCKSSTYSLCLANAGPFKQWHELQLDPSSIRARKARGWPHVHQTWSSFGRPVHHHLPPLKSLRGLINP